jgi:thermitase
VRLLALVVLALAALPARAYAADIIVRREPGLARAERAGIRSDAGVTLVGATTLPDTEVVRTGDPQAALAALNADPDVSYAELDRSVHALTNDPQFNQQWALVNTGQFGGLAGADMDVPDAWELSEGAGVTVAIVDTGVDASVADLAGQLAGNPGEVAGNGVDDDHNGLVDDSRGWDFSAGDNDPADQHGHGTHVAGTVAALAGNGIGVAGVAPQAHVLAVRALNSSGSGSDSTIAEAFDYAGDLGVRIVNASLGGPGASQTLTDAMTAHPNTLYVIAAGNDGANNDASPVFPCTSPAPNVLCVGATDPRDLRASFSNYGAATVDVFAPGQWIDSTLEGGGFGLMSGTSMASPNVAGAAALALAVNPAATTAQLKAALIDSVDPVAGLSGYAVAGGRVNAAAAVTALEAAPLVTPTPTPTPTPTATPVAPPVATPTPAPAASATPAAPPAAAPAPAAAEVRTLKLSGTLRGRSGKLEATFTLTRGTAVRVSIARGGRAMAADASWSLPAHAGANRLRLTRRVAGRTLARGRYTLKVSAGGSARTASFSVR